MREDNHWVNVFYVCCFVVVAEPDSLSKCSCADYSCTECIDDGKAIISGSGHVSHNQSSDYSCGDLN